MALSQICIFCLILIIIRSVVSQYPHDKSICSSENAADSVSNHQCRFSRSVSCDTFIVYRAQKDYSRVSSIASLFNITTSELLSHNNISQGDQEILQPDREIIVPVKCSCSATFFFVVDFEYKASQSESFSSIACETFEGLVKVKNLREYNPGFEGNVLNVDASIQVPVKCTCPNTSDTENSTNYMITYPIMEYDDPGLIARKFEVPQEIIRDANQLGPFDAIFPGTTLFIPLNKTPVLNLNVVSPPQDSSLNPGAIPTGGDDSSPISRTITFYVMLGGLVFAGITSITVIFGTLICVWLRNRPGLVQSLSRKMSKLARFSPDFLEGILQLKQSITYFCLDELKIATENFNEASVLDSGVYRGKIGDSYVVIKQVDSIEEANSVICILSRLYHFNVLKLQGICEDKTPYLVFEFVENGSLSECLLNSKLAKELTWKRRIQIILDLAEGLHYLHFFTKPTYVHRKINSRNILVTADWRAKISGFGSAKALNCSEEKGESNSRVSFLNGEEYMAPEFLKYGQASSKMDIYAFGVIILELLSGKEATNNTNLLKEFVKLSSITEPQDPSEYLQRLEIFIDPLLGKDYPMTDVLYLAFLAKGCTQDDPLNRPTMNDILKALSNILFF